MWTRESSRYSHTDVIKWRHYPRYWPFVRGIHRPPVDSPHKGRWPGALIFSLISAWTNGRANNREAGDLRRHRAHYDITMCALTKQTPAMPIPPPHSQASFTGYPISAHSSVLNNGISACFRSVGYSPSGRKMVPWGIGIAGYIIIFLIDCTKLICCFSYPCIIICPSHHDHVNVFATIDSWVEGMNARTPLPF